jgi:sec-independent protein translocase protein TatC
MRKTVLLGLAVLLVLSPTAAAAPAQVWLEAAGGAWNGGSIVETPGPAEVAVWVPANARVQQVLARGGDGSLAPAGWRAASPDALLVELPEGASAAVVRFDVPPRAPYLFRYVASEGVDRVTLELRVPPGSLAESPHVQLEAGRASVAVAEGDVIAVRIVDAGRVGELPLLVTIGGLATIVLAATLAWHRARPPLGGRAPERFVDHLAELQTRLLPPAALFALLNVFYFVSGLRALDVGGITLVAPTWGVDASIAARAFDAVAERLVPPDVTLVVLRPADAVLAQVGMSLFLSFATVLPLLVYELGAFIAPGLETRERRVALRVLPLVTGLFLAGALLAYLVMAPLMIRTLYAYAPGIGAAPLLAVGELVSFALLIILALGLAFELPVVMYVLGRLGIVRASTFGRYVRHAVLVIVVAAGLITPDPSVVSQLLLAVPIIALYVLGIGAARLGEHARPLA